MVGRDRTQPSLTRGAILSKLMNWENDSSCPCFVYYQVIYLHLTAYQYLKNTSCLSAYQLLLLLVPLKIFPCFHFDVCMYVQKGLPMFSFWCMSILLKVVSMFSLWCQSGCLTNQQTLGRHITHYACSNEGRQTLRLNIFVCDQNCGFWAQGPPFSKIGSKIARIQNFQDYLFNMFIISHIEPTYLK